MLGLNKPEYNLGNHDIEHSRPDCVKFKTERSYDPLNPSYNLSKVEIRPITPPRFIRDNIHHDDIEGSKPKKPAYYETRGSILETKDIEGCKPRDRTFNRKDNFESINYRDVTHADFKTKRTTNPLSPSYVVRNEDGTVEQIGNIEGNVPNKIPERKKGPVSQSLQTNDIEGAQSGTKGLGVFAHHSRTGFKHTNRLDDIAGSTVGSLRKGPATNRMSNPLNPDYAIPGATEYGENNGFGTTGQQVITGTKPFKPSQPPKLTKPPIKMPNNINRDNFKRDINTFYGTDDKNFADIDFNKLYKATKDPNATAVAPGVPEHFQNDMSFKRDAKKFYGQSQTSESEYNYVQHKFYEDTVGKRDTDPNKFTSLGQPAPQRKLETPVSNQHFKRDQAKFYGEEYVPSDKSSDRGSIFQNNAAQFYGMEAPAHGEKPFKITQKDLADPRKDQPKNVSVLNEMRLKEHEQNWKRDPKYDKNLRKFWGMKSQPTDSNASGSNKSYAQKLDNFIGY